MSNFANRAGAGLFAVILASSFLPTAVIAEALDEGSGWQADKVEVVDEATSGEDGVEPAPPTSSQSDDVAKGPGRYLVSYCDEHGDTHSKVCYDLGLVADDGGITLRDGSALPEGHLLPPGWYVVKSDKVFSNQRITFIGDVNLVLCDGATLTCKQGIGNLGSITVWGQEKGTGKLVADARGIKHPFATHAAGIGGLYEGDSGGSLVVHGGEIEAFGRSGSAAIGGAYKGDGGDITILGGVVRAHGGSQAAGIGGGLYGPGGIITISGGRVYADALDSNSYYAAGAGIGGGDDGDTGQITIDGGDILARGYQAIGCGEDGSKSKIEGVDDSVKIDTNKVYFFKGSASGKKARIMSKHP